MADNEDKFDITNKEYKIMYSDQYGSYSKLTSDYFKKLEQHGVKQEKADQINSWLEEIATIKHGSDFGIWGDDGIPSLYYDLPEIANEGITVYLKPDNGLLEVDEEGVGNIDSLKASEIDSRVKIENFLASIEDKIIQNWNK